MRTVVACKLIDAQIFKKRLGKNESTTLLGFAVKISSIDENNNRLNRIVRPSLMSPKNYG